MQEDVLSLTARVWEKVWHVRLQRAQERKALSVEEAKRKALSVAEAEEEWRKNDCWDEGWRESEGKWQEGNYGIQEEEEQKHEQEAGMGEVLELSLIHI